MADLYRVLGVSSRATGSEIKSAYRRLARRYHPDVSASPDANERFARISEAYRVLSDPALRARYDRGEQLYARTTFYASRAAQVVAYQRKFDRVVDEMIARERQESDARSHAVFVVVTLFVSGFYVAFAKPKIIEDSGVLGRIFVVSVALYAVWYLLRNLKIVLARYTYTVPNRVTSVLRAEADATNNKLVSRSVGLVFIVCGYLVFLGLGIIMSRLTRLHYGPPFSPGMILGVFLYPPIAVLIIGGFRRIGGLLDRF